MSQDTMMVTAQESTPPLVQVSRTPNSVIPATGAPRPARREHSDSRHGSVATGGMFPIGFGMRKELLDPAAIGAAVYRNDGLEFTRERIKSAFYGQWGVEARLYEAQQAAATQALQTLEKEHLRITELLKEVPPTKTINGPALPSGVAHWGWWGLVVALVILNLLAITNAAAYFRFLAQGWFFALLAAAPLLFVSVPVKFIGRKLNEAARRRLGWSLASLGVAAFSIFVFTIAARANPPSTADILDGTASLGTGLIPWQLASQIILEVVIAAALWHWLMELMTVNCKLVINPDAEVLTARLSTLQTAMEPIRTQLANAQGNLEEFRASLAHWVQTAETIFLVHFERERRLVERVEALNLAPKF